MFGRDGTDPALMKPSPYRVRQAVGSLGAEPRECAFIGDSTSDVLAGRLAGVRGNRLCQQAGKADALTDAVIRVR